MMTATGAERGVGLVGSKTYQASAPRPPELTLQLWKGTSLLPGPDVGCAGWVMRAEAAAATVDGGSGERRTDVDVDVRARREDRSEPASLLQATSDMRAAIATITEAARRPRPGRPITRTSSGARW
ncbi:MAG: hypothetical protein M3Z46_00830 [Actinomycetota bacterium]|nr:hypothetical protein [Actinomycetota bacterium]